MTELNKNALLADGRVLCSLKNLFLQEPTKDNLNIVLACLSSADVLVPMQKDSIPTEVTEDGTMVTKDAVNLRPDLLRSSEGGLFFPLFTREEEIPEDYRHRFTFVSLPAVQCIRVASASAELQGMIIDPFTAPLELAMKTAKVVLKLNEDTEPQA